MVLLLLFTNEAGWEFTILKILYTVLTDNVWRHQSIVLRTEAINILCTEISYYSCTFETQVIKNCLFQQIHFTVIYVYPILPFLQTCSSGHINWELLMLLPFITTWNIEYSCPGLALRRQLKSLQQRCLYNNIIIMDFFAVPEISGETPCIWNHFIEEKFTFHTESSVQAGSWPV